MVKAIALIGPTASGKSDLAMELAKAFSGELVCCDSMQIYEEMCIGTARPKLSEQEGIPHHLYGTVSLQTPFNASLYEELALPLLDQIQERGHLPILCGGTGLYLDALRTLRHEGTPGEDPLFRQELEKQAETEEGQLRLYQQLLEVDPTSAEKTHPHNARRVIRALELYHLTGKTKTELDRMSSQKNPNLDLLTFGLRFENKDLLRERIKVRIQKMLKEGLLEELKELDEKHLFETSKTASQAIGYKELLPALHGTCSMEQAIQDLEYATIHYAKRQMTYFQKMEDVIWISRDHDGALWSPKELLLQVQPIIQSFLEKE